MKGHTLKVSDIAQQTGLDEAQVRLLVEDYGSVLPSRKIGRVSLFEPGVVPLVHSIVELSEQGTGQDEILAKFQKKTRKTVAELIRGRPETKPKEGKRSVATPPVRVQPQPQSTLHGEKKANIQGKRSNPTSVIDDSFAAQDRRIARLIARTEVLEKEISSMKAASDRYAGEQKSRDAMVQDQITCTDEWIGYFEARLDTITSGQRELQESMTVWVEYFDEEIAWMKLTRLEKFRRALNGDNKR